MSENRGRERVCVCVCVRELFIFLRIDPVYESLSVHLTEDTTSSDSDDDMDDEYDRDGDSRTVNPVTSLTAIV